MGQQTFPQEKHRTGIIMIWLNPGRCLATD